MSELIGYVTIEEADSYISSHFLSSDEKRESWEAMNEEDKKVLLTKSLEDIESLNFSGYKTCKDQELSFPRNGCLDVPQNVKNAQIEGAIARLDTDSSFESIQKGITSERLGSVSYTYSTSTIYKTGARPEVMKFLRGYMKKIYSFR